MKISLSSLIAILFVFPLVGQIHTTPSEKIDYVKNVHSVGKLGGELYSLVYKKKEAYLRVHSVARLDLVREVKLNLKKNGHHRLVEDAFLFDSAFVYITSYAVLDKNIRVVEYNKIESDGVEESSVLTELSMLNLPIGNWREYALTVHCLVSPDQKNFALVYQDQLHKNSVNNRSVVVYDASLNRVLSTIANVDFSLRKNTLIPFEIENQLILFDNACLVYHDVQGPIVYSKSDSFLIKLSEPTNNYLISQSSNGAMVVCGLYSELNSGFLVIASGEGFGFIVQKVFSVENASGFAVKDLIIRENRDVLLVAEGHVSEVSSGYKTTYISSTSGVPKTRVRTKSSHQHVELGGVVLMNITPAGSVTWRYDLPANTNDLNESFVSSAIFSEGNNTYVFYNSQEEVKEEDGGLAEKVVPVVGIIHSDGLMMVEPLFQDVETSFLVPNKCNRVEGGIFLQMKDAFCYYGK